MILLLQVELRLVALPQQLGAALQVVGHVVHRYSVFCVEGDVALAVVGLLRLQELRQQDLDTNVSNLLRRKGRVG